MVTKMLERAIEIEGLLRIIRDGNPLPETYTLLSNKAVELADAAMLLEEKIAAEPQHIKDQEPNIKDQEPTPISEEAVSSVEEASGDVQESNAIGEDASSTVQQPAAKDEDSEKEEVSMILMTNEPTESIQREEETPRPEPEIVITDIAGTEKEEHVRENPHIENLHEELFEGEEEAINVYDTSSADEATQPETEQTSTIDAAETNDSEETAIAESSPIANQEDDDILLTIEEEEEESSAIQEPTHQHEDKPKQAFKRQVKLKSAFSLNDRFLYSRELFDGDMKMFDSTLEFIEGIEDFSIIEDYFYSELEWNPEDMAVASFMEILRPHFRE